MRAVSELGLDIRPSHEVNNLTMAMSLIASTHSVALAPTYARNYLPSTVTTRPLQGKAPTIDLVVGYQKANSSPILRLFVSRLVELVDPNPRPYEGGECAISSSTVRRSASAGSVTSR